VEEEGAAVELEAGVRKLAEKPGEQDVGALCSARVHER
jgi:hypothetical protein